MKRAFTLIELLVTMGLLVLLAAFSVPTYQLLIAQAELTSSANQLLGYMLLTQQKTVTEQKIYGLDFVQNGSTITQILYTPPVPPANTGTTVNQSPVFTLPTNTVVSQISLPGSATEIRFSTSAAPNVSGYIVIKDTVRNRNKKITISPSGSITANQAEY